MKNKTRSVVLKRQGYLFPELGDPRFTGNATAILTPLPDKEAVSSWKTEPENRSIPSSNNESPPKGDIPGRYDPLTVSAGSSSASEGGAADRCAGISIVSDPRGVVVSDRAAGYPVEMQATTTSTIPCIVDPVLEAGSAATCNTEGVAAGADADPCESGSSDTLAASSSPHQNELLVGLTGSHSDGADTMPNCDNFRDRIIIYQDVEAVSGNASAAAPRNLHQSGGDHAHGAGFF
jgi:hypothetical protein